ncbi:PREDICTED: putative nuclease HARBI1 [Camelina sativa]|uniref:Nuclease HARBI1 n=1 Tax=Camelina sativa TaxID=90675 RepID=A0ABM1R7E2_CAMSA|nr:PREDICTED: putative nuclease HARBI1 [Camelina sativa]
MAKPGLTVPAKIRESTRYYPYFKDCVGAIDGTHIHAMVPTNDASSYRNQKGYTSQNVLAACNFDLEFIYVLSGWEGTAHDSKVLSDAVARSKSKLPVPEETSIGHEENSNEENGDTGTLQSQQKDYANNWRDTIAANMWAEATGTGSMP